MAEIKWAVLGTGVIANEMAAALAKGGRNIYAVGNRTHSKAVAFAEKYGIEKVYDDFEEMFTDPDVDVIYITTPHNTHLPFMEKALRGGKHVLAEKSITLNSAELERVRALAKEKKLILAEAMTIYHMPLYRKLREILASGRLGKVNLITMNFGSFKEYDMQNRFSIVILPAVRCLISVYMPCRLCGGLWSLNRTSCFRSIIRHRPEWTSHRFSYSKMQKRKWQQWH